MTNLHKAQLASPDTLPRHQQWNGIFLAITTLNDNDSVIVTAAARPETARLS